jgi:hypothetical protein
MQLTVILPLFLYDNRTKDAHSRSMKPILALLLVMTALHGAEPELWYSNHGTPGSDGKKQPPELKLAKSGRPVRMSMTGSSVSLSDLSDMPWNKEFTISAWIMVNGTPFATNRSGYGMIFFRGDDRDGLDPIYIAQDNSSIVFHLESEKAEVAVLTVAVPQKTWVHLAMVFNSSKQLLTVYKDGDQAGSLTTKVIPMIKLDPSAQGGIGIGNNAWHPGSKHNMPFNGVVNTLSVYRNALSEAEIKKMVKETNRPSFGPMTRLE